MNHPQGKPETLEEICDRIWKAAWSVSSSSQMMDFTKALLADPAILPHIAAMQGWKLMPPEMTERMTHAVQMNSEMGAWIAANWTGAYSCFDEFYRILLATSPDKQEG